MAKSHAKRSAKTIDLDCPGCEALLELDRGFAGGVCRCSTCGTLMTVPRDAADKPERLERPEAPGMDARPERPDRPDRPDRPGVPKRSGAASGGPGGTSYTRSARPSKKRPASAQPPPPPRGKETFQTASGRTVTVDHARVPMAASKRHAVRAATVLVFVAVVGGTLALCGFAAFMLLSEPTAQERAAAAHVATFPYDPSANPYAIASPNLWGLPLANRVGVLIEPSGMSPDALDAVREALLDGLTRDAPNVRVFALKADADGDGIGLVWDTPLGGGEAADARSLSANLSAELSEASTRAEPGDLAAAVAQLLGADPQVLILVVGRDLADAETDAIQAFLPESGVRFDALLVEVDSFGLEDAAQSTNGHYVTLDSAFDVAAWGPAE